MTKTKKNIKEFKDLLKTFKWILSNAKPVIPFLIFTILISSTLSAIGVYNAMLSKSLIDAAIGGNKSQVIKLLVIMASIMIGRMLISPITSFLSTHASVTLSQNIQKKMYKHITYSEWMDQSKFHSVSLLTRITSDVGTISSMLLGTIPSIISLGVTFTLSFSALVYLAPSIAIVAVFIGPVLLVISKLFGRKLKKLYKEIQEEDVKYRSFIQESIQNIMIVKTFCMEKTNLIRLSAIQKNKYNLAMRNTKLSVLSGISMTFCSSLAYFTIFCWGTLNISNGIGTYGTFTAMLQLYSNIQGPFSALASMFPSLIGAVAACERLMEIEAMALENTNIKALPEKIEKPIIEFKDISFKYNDNSPVINNANLKINAGETIAFVGPSGEGKTTLIRLLLSLIHSDNGTITINDSNKKTNINETALTNTNNDLSLYENIVNDYSSELNRNHRELISYVPQGNTLFSGTIEDNLRYGKFDATFDELKSASELACALDFINNLDEGFNTLIGEKGTGISEGQAQRLSIARALLRKKPILILDEATSSLDGETEINVLKSIKELDHKPTCIIITHRPSALSICDKVFKLEKGKLTQSINVNLETANTSFL